jgi:hypothetical protein
MREKYCTSDLEDALGKGSQTPSPNLDHPRISAHKFAPAAITTSIASLILHATRPPMSQSRFGKISVEIAKRLLPHTGSISIIPTCDHRGS